MGAGLEARLAAGREIARAGPAQEALKEKPESTSLRRGNAI
jgi:hypothetical protein